MRRFLSGKWLVQLLGVGLFLFVLSHVDLAAAFALLAHINLSTFLVAMALSVPMVLTRAWRWRYVLRSIGVSITYGRAVNQHLIGSAGGFMTPGQLGEFVKVVYLQRDGYKLWQGVYGVVLDRVLDVMVWAVAAMTTVLVFGGNFLRFRFVLLVMVVMIVGLIMMLRNPAAILRQFPGRLRRFTPARFRDILAVSEQNWGLPRPSLITLLTLSAISCVVFCLLTGRVYLFASSLSIPITLPEMVVCYSVLLVVGLLPTGFFGIGTRDAVLVLLFSFIGLPREAALALSLLMLIQMIAQSLLGTYLWLRNPIEVGM